MAMRRLTKDAVEHFLTDILNCEKMKERAGRYDIWLTPNGAHFMVPTRSEEPDGLYPDYLLDDIVDSVGPSPSEYVTAAPEKQAV